MENLDKTKPKKMLNLRIDEELYQKIKDRASATNDTTTNIVVKAINIFFENSNENIASENQKTIIEPNSTKVKKKIKIIKKK